MKGEVHWTRDGNYLVRFTRVDGKQKKIYQHREVWEESNGTIPPGMQVDHINHDGTDNRLENLRLVNVSGNQQNRAGANRNSLSGERCIYWHKQRGKWHVQKMIKGKKKSLGLYQSFQEAVKVRNKYEKEFANA